MLTDQKIKSLKPKTKPYKVTDGSGMFLLIKPNGGKYWRLKYRIAGKEKTLAIGVYPEVTLRNARDDARRRIHEGFDPLQDKQKQKQLSNHVFEKVAREWVDRKRSQWSQKHADKVLRSLVLDIFPSIGQQSCKRLKRGNISS